MKKMRPLFPQTFLAFLISILSSSCTPGNSGDDSTTTQRDSASTVTDSDSSTGPVSPAGTDSETTATPAGTDSEMPVAPNGCGGCVINDICVPDGFVPVQNSCLICNIGLSKTSWSNLNGAVCDDGQFCTTGDMCSNGQCVGAGPSPCIDDGVFCNGIESCNETTDTCTLTNIPCNQSGEYCVEDQNSCCVPNVAVADSLYCTVEGNVAGQDSCGTEVFVEHCVTPLWNGKCTNGVCGCTRGFAGEYCTYCALGFTGENCERCEPGLAGQHCEKCVVFVNSSPIAQETRDGRTWETALANVQDGINAGWETGCEVWVAKGTYHPTRDAAKHRA